MKYGIKSVTMDDVARELAISKKTLYQYFSDKNDLVHKVVELEMRERTGYFEKMCCDNMNAIEQVFEVHKILHKMIKDYNPATEYDLKKYYPELYTKIIKARRERIYNNIIANLKKGKAEGLYRSELNEDIIAKLQISRVEAAFDNQIFSQDEMLSDRIFIEIFVYHIRGIATEKGLKELDKEIEKFMNINN
jgi:AcrR family transcriptional regulator